MVFKKIRDRIANSLKREGILYSIYSYLLFKITKHYYSFRYFMKKRQLISMYLQHNKIRKIHFGSGRNKLAGFLNTDIFSEIPIDIADNLPFPNGSVDLIYSAHTVEHIHNREFKKFLKESFRILKNGGIHIIQTPSLEKLVKTLYLKNSTNKKLLIARHGGFEKCFDDQCFACNLLNNMIHINYGHKYIYDFEYISYLARKAGYKSVKKVQNSSTPDEVINASLRVKIHKEPVWDAETETFVLENS